MNYCDYIQSKDIRQHLRDLGYRFSSLEAAWLIYQCKSINMKERHLAWHELMKTMPDCDMPVRPSCTVGGTLFEYLTNYMQLEEKMLKHFYENDGAAIYWHEGEFITKDGDLSDAFDFYPYSSVEKAIDSITDYAMLEQFRSITISKVLVDNNSQFDLVFDIDGEPVSVTDYQLDDEDEHILNKGFKGLWFNFPLPFKRGDILWNQYSSMNHFAFVFLDDIFLFANQSKKEWLQNGGTMEDMGVVGIVSSFYPTGPENIHDLMNIEKYDKPLTAFGKGLEAISQYVKGEICAEEFKAIYLDVYVDNYKKQIEQGFDNIVSWGCKPTMDYKAEAPLLLY